MENLYNNYYDQQLQKYQPDFFDGGDTSSGSLVANTNNLSPTSFTTDPYGATLSAPDPKNVPTDINTGNAWQWDPVWQKANGFVQANNRGIDRDMSLVPYWDKLKQEAQTDGSNIHNDPSWNNWRTLIEHTIRNTTPFIRL